MPNGRQAGQATLRKLFIIIILKRTGRGVFINCLIEKTTFEIFIKCGFQIIVNVKKSVIASKAKQ